MAEPRTLLSTALPPTVQIDSPPPGPPNTLELSAIGKNDNMEQDGIFTISGQLHTVATTPSDLNETVMTNDSQSEFVTTTDIHERQREQLREAGFDPDEFEEGRDCGYGKCRPDCMQTCANIKMFIFVMCILSLFSGSISAGYFNSVITTVEKRFEIGSSLSGVIAASFEFGSLVAVIFVSYFGARRHIPRLVGIGGLLISLGAFMFTLPHFLAESYTIKGGFINSTEHDNICKIPTSTSLSQPGSTATLGSAAMMNCVDSESGNGIYVFILILAQVLVGVGGTPIYTLGTTYIDNHVPKDKAPSLIAFIYATSALGPVVGFGLGALLLQYYVDAFSYDYRTLNLTTEDPRWVGAWWGGFLLFGSVLILIAIPFFGFPKTLHADLEAKILKDKGKTESEVGEPKDDEYGKTIKDIPRAVCSLLRNAIYLLTCFGVCCELAIVSGFLTFLAKYIEHQFSINKSQANLFTGGIAIPGAVLGVLLGGFLMRKLQLKPKGAIQMTLILNGLAIGVMVLLLFTGCENRKIAGATMPYSAGLDDSLEFEANLTSSCNDACSCSTRAIDLICGANDITYFSPCHAGCTHFYANNNDVVKDDSDRVLSNIKNYTDCSCIVTNSSTDIIVSQLARSGPCPHECKNFVYFMILLFGATFLTAGTQMPLLMVTMRSVAEEERSFALGMQFVIMRLLAYIPSPIMFGNLIDTTCLVWQKHCEANGSCLVYNIEQFRFKYLGEFLQVE
ncbi:solute carrier organic anion transporter family member 5A1 [Lingula anatina]|uniref:Solute carrier organic anion transporter family member n=1 Tax=Lingula anatina TaxID=7574 RepID=A0A2R2MPA6_LINAN|nr:solute carrier organic anion transporter family member 5A1 [Lingula anatina]|eukprot:XP_023932071.1 solute carrier organic anion transporter family member 5A1 [Lingula anatina]